MYRKCHGGGGGWGGGESGKSYGCGKICGKIETLSDWREKNCVLVDIEPQLW